MLWPAYLCQKGKKKYFEVLWNQALKDMIKVVLYKTIASKLQSNVLWS